MFTTKENPIAHNKQTHLQFQLLFLKQQTNFVNLLKLLQRPIGARRTSVSTSCMWVFIYITISIHVCIHLRVYVSEQTHMEHSKRKRRMDQ